MTNKTKKIDLQEKGKLKKTRKNLKKNSKEWERLKEIGGKKKEERP